MFSKKENQIICDNNDAVVDLKEKQSGEFEPILTLLLLLDMCEGSWLQMIAKKYNTKIEVQI